MNYPDWEKRVSRLWASFDDLTETDFLDAMERLAAELPEESAVAAYERASAFDSTGHSDLAVPLYGKALELGLDEGRRRSAVIQMSSSIRNLGDPERSIELLTAERESHSDELDDAVVAFLALALSDVGREREALSLSLAALATHLPKYQRSVKNYAAGIQNIQH